MKIFTATRASRQRGGIDNPARSLTNNVRTPTAKDYLGNVLVTNYVQYVQYLYGIAVCTLAAACTVCISRPLYGSGSGVCVYFVMCI